MAVIVDLCWCVCVCVWCRKTEALYLVSGPALQAQGERVQEGHGLSQSHLPQGDSSRGTSYTYKTKMFYLETDDYILDGREGKLCARVDYNQLDDPLPFMIYTPIFYRKAV